MKRFFSMLIMLTLLAGMMAFPAFATVEGLDVEVSADGPVYYYNDFTSDVKHSIIKSSDAVAELDTERGVLILKKGTIKFNTSEITSDTRTLSNSGTNYRREYIAVNDYSGKKPNLCLEYRVHVNDLAGANLGSGATGVYNQTNYGIEHVVFTGLKIDAYPYTTAGGSGTWFLNENTNGKTYDIKILYSAEERIRTVYINGVCYGTFINTTANDTKQINWNASDKRFHLSFIKNKQSTSPTDFFEIDYVKVSRWDEEMIKVPYTIDNTANVVPVKSAATDNTLWIPKGEQVKVNLFATSGKQCDVSLNGEKYMEGFSGDFSFKTPALTSSTDTITITSKTKVDGLTSYTSPYVYPITKEDGTKSVIIFGRMTNKTGYTNDSCGMLFSLTDSTLTFGNEGVYKAEAEKAKVIGGNYAIELIDDADLLTQGTTLYYGSYADYTNADDETDKQSVYGDVKSIEIEE